MADQGEPQRIKPGDTSSITLLTDSASYTMWAFEIKNLLKAKGLINIADGTVEINEVPGDQQNLWVEKDAEASTYLTSTCAPKVKQLLLTCETAHEIYSKLQATFERDSAHQVCSLMQQLYAYNWDRSKNVMENVSHIQNIAHQLNALEQPVNELAIITKITNILPPEYQSFSSAWDLAPTAEKNLEHLTASLQQEETKLKTNMVEQPAAFKAEARPGNTKGSQSQQGKKTGRRQGKRGRGPPRRESSPEGRRKCYICKSKTSFHDPKDCYFREKWCGICRTNSHWQKDCDRRRDRWCKRRHEDNEPRSPKRSRPNQDRDYEENRGGRRDKACHLANTKSTKNNQKVKSKIIRIVSRDDTSPETYSP